MLAIPRIKVRNLDDFIDELPPVSQKLVRNAVIAFSNKPCERSAHLRGFFTGKLHPRYPLNSRIGHAFAESILIQGAQSVTEHERMVSKKVYGVPDPFGLALDFCTLLALRLEKVPFASTDKKQGYLRCVQVGISRAGTCR